MAKKILADVTASGNVTATKGLVLPGTIAPITANGLTGALGQVLTSAGNTSTPYWSTPMTPGSSGVPFRIGAGSYLGGNALASSTQEVITITLPVNRFTVAPIVMVNSTAPRYVLAVGTVTTSSANVTVRNVSEATGGTYNLYFHAIQMTSTTAAG